MNDDLQTYIEPELEARIVALVLGESSAFEAEELERLMTEKPELRAYWAGLEKIHGVVSDAHREQDDESWKLSEDKRGKVQAKIDERKRHEMVLARRERISKVAQRRLLYACAACIVLTLVIIVLSQPLDSMRDKGQIRVAPVESEVKEGRSVRFSGSANFSAPGEEFEREEKRDNTLVLKVPSETPTEDMEGLLAQLDDAILSDNLRAINDIRILESAERDVEKEPSPQLPRREIAPVSEIPEHSHETDRFLKEKQGQQKTNIGRSNNQGGEVAKKSEMRQKSIRRSKVEKKPVASASAGNGVISASANRPSAVPVPKSVRIDPSADFEDGENFGEGWGGQVFKNERSSEDGSFEGDKLSKFEFVESKAEYDPPELPKEVVGGIGDKQKFGSVFGGVSSFPATSARPSERVVSDHKSVPEREGAPSDERSANGKRILGKDGTRSPRKFSTSGRGNVVKPQHLMEVEERKSPKLKIVDAVSDKEETNNILDQDIDGGLAKPLAGKMSEKKVRDRLGANATDGKITSGRRGQNLESEVLLRESDSLKKDLEQSDGLVELSQADRGQGNYDKSRNLLPEAQQNPLDLIDDSKELEYLVVPIETESLSDYEYTKDANKIRQTLDKGEALVNLGFYDKAEEEFKEILKNDPQNKAARLGMSRTSASRSSYYRAAYDETRNEMLNTVDKEWETSIDEDPFGETRGESAKGLVNEKVRDLRGNLNALSDRSTLGKENGRSGNFFEVTGLVADADPFSADGDEEERPELVSSAEIGGNLSSFDPQMNAKDVPLYAMLKTMDVEAEPTLERLNEIVIPEIKLENATVNEAIEFLRSRSVELDFNGLENSDKEVEFKVVNPDSPVVEKNELVGVGNTVAPGETKIAKLDLKNVTAGVALQYIADAAKLHYTIDGNGVTFLPVGGGEAADILQRRWDLSPEVVAEVRGATANGKSLETVLKENGVSFMQGASVTFLEDDNTLIVRNSPSNLELVDGIVGAAQVFAKKKARNREEEWLLGEKDAEAPSVPKVEVIQPKFIVTPPNKIKTVASFEISTEDKTDSTFSLNVSDVSFKLAKVALSQGNWPDASKIRPEEFVNALDYDDAKPNQAEKVSCEIEQGVHPFMQQRNLMRVSMNTASVGRNATTPLRLTILLDQSGSMERADRAKSVQRAFALLASQLTKDDEITLVGFARTSRLLAERVKGDEAKKLANFVANPLSEGGTNLEEALATGLQLAKQQFLQGAQNRVILLTDGAANLGDAKPANLSRQVESMRRSDIAFDACGVGADGLNDDILSLLAKQGDGRYYFLDRPEDADSGFAHQIAGALRPAAKNVKIQVVFNPKRVSTFKLYGFEKHKLKKEDFRNDSVDAAEMAAEESGVALYQFEPIPEGLGDIGTVSVRFLDTASNQMVERTWTIPYEEESAFFSEADPRLRLASVAGLFSEKIKGSAVGERVELKRLRQEVQLLKPSFGNQARFNELRSMLRQAGD